ncbi:MAG: 30S ribosomal protein S13 [Candidatus Diapherotrites archaeon]|nr:30S ribosomal protein S13 [Candidatus Diapherotrites archaeon]
MAEIRNIVRIAGFDLDGTKPIWFALTGVKGVGINFAKMVSKIVAEKFGVDVNTKLGELPEEADAFIEEVIRNPIKYGIPRWAVNDPKDWWTGEDRHLVGTDLETHLVAVKKRLFEIRSWRGIRLAKGLKVRGQRTKSHPRKNKISVVGRKKKGR